MNRIASIASSNSQLATLVLAIGNISTLATLTKMFVWGGRGNGEEGQMFSRRGAEEFLDRIYRIDRIM